MAKTITRQQLAGSQGEAFVCERANAMGFVFTPHGQVEAGIDGFRAARGAKSTDLAERPEPSDAFDITTLCQRAGL